jgi:hypothetical protein
MRELMLGSRVADYVAIKVLRRRYPEATDYWDGNWVEAEVEMVVRPWRGVYEANLRTDELLRFRRQLKDMNEGNRHEARLAPMEPWVELTLERDSSGHVGLKGESGPGGFGRAFGQVRLVFELQGVIDQASLVSLIAGLEEIEAEFPVIGEPSR